MSSHPVDLLTRRIEVASLAVRMAGAVHTHFLRQDNLDIKTKGDDANDLATQVDEDAQAAAVAVIANARELLPTLIIGEESLIHIAADGITRTEGEVKQADGRWLPPSEKSYWLIDGLDGTQNFVHGIPLFSTAVAYVEDGQPVIGACFIPMLDELYQVRRSQAPTCNGQPLTLARQTAFETAYLASDAPQRLRFKGGQPPPNLQIRNYGSPVLSLAFLAAGRFDGYIYTPPRNRQRMGPWDVAVGALLVTEGGGHVASPNGGPFDLWSGGIIAACTPDLQDHLIAALDLG